MKLLTNKQEAQTLYLYLVKDFTKWYYRDLRRGGSTIRYHGESSSGDFSEWSLLDRKCHLACYQLCHSSELDNPYPLDSKLLKKWSIKQITSILQHTQAQIDKRHNS